MRKKQKRLLGLLGLSVVAIMFGIAVGIPEQRALATTTSVVDQLTIRVTKESPDVSIISSADESVEISPSQNFTITYESVDNVTITIEYTDQNGERQTKVIDNFSTDSDSGEKNYSISLKDGEDGFGYGEYKITVRGTDDNGVYDEKSIEFEYVPVIANVETDEDGEQYINLDYIPDDGTDDSEGDVDKIVIIIKDEDGNEIPNIPPIVVPAPQDVVPLPFDENDLPSGKYIIEVLAYDEDKAEDEPLYKPTNLPVKYDAEEGIIVPDTGSFSKIMNFARTDYLISAAAVFGLVVVSGLFIIIKPSNKKKTNGKK